MVLLHPVPDFYMSYDACEAGREWGLDILSLSVHFGDLISYCLVMIVQ